MVIIEASRYSSILDISRHFTTQIVMQAGGACLYLLTILTRRFFSQIELKGKEYVRSNRWGYRWVCLRTEWH